MEQKINRISVRTISLENIDESKGNDAANWKNIIFLPFNNYWEFFLMGSIVVNFIVCIYVIVFKLNVEIDIFYACELIYFIDTVAVVTHRNMIRYRKQRYHEKKSMFTILISVVSLIPVYQFYNLIFAYNKNHNPNYLSCAKLLCGLRLFRLFAYFEEKSNDVGCKQLTMVLLEHLVNLQLIMSVLTSILYSIGCWGCSYPNWTSDLVNHKFDRNNLYEWIVVCYSVVAGLWSRCWSGIVNSVTSAEDVYVIFIMLFGFVFHMLIFFGQLTAAFLQNYRHHFEFTTRLKKIIYLLDDWHVDKNVKRRTIEYYETYWEQRKGIKIIPSTVGLLPLSLRKEVNLDIFWEALRHTHLFSDADISFKRSVSLVMRNEFFLTGDYLFKLGEPKHKLYFIKSGIVNQISDEDNESSVVTFSDGTVLGEMSVLMHVPSKVSIKCDSYCEVQSLEMLDLFRVLLQFPGMTQKLTHTMRERIRYCKWAMSDLVVRSDVDLYKTPIKNLKEQWRCISKLCRSNRIEDNDWRNLNKSFTSNYLDLLVISDAVELKVNAICLKTTCPLVMSPTSSFKLFLDYVVLVGVSLEIYILPYPVFFLGHVPDSLFAITTVLDMVYAFDIYLQLSTAVKVPNNKDIIKPTDILLYRFKEIGFILDVISVLPYNTLLIPFGIPERISTLFKIPRLVKVYKIFKLIYKQEKSLWVNNLYVRLLKYFVFYTIAIYWTCCILYASACFNEVCFETHWFRYNIELRNVSQDISDFVKVLYFSTSLLLNINISDNYFFNMFDMVLSIAIIYLSYLAYSFTLSELTASAVLLNKETYAHQDEITMFKVIMKRRFVHKDLKNRLLNILEFNWCYNEGAEIKGKHGILSEASDKIRTEIIYDRFINCLKHVPLFKGCPETLLKKMSLHAEVIILPPETFIQNINVMSHSVYIILRGYCQMNSMLPGDAENNSKIILKYGDMLAVIETLHRIRIFGSIVSVTAVELLSISYEAFVDIFQSYRTEYMFLQNALREHMEQYESILMRKGCRLPAMRSVMPALGQVNTFSYDIFERKTFTTEDDYMKPFNEIGQWSFLRYFLLRNTIDPMKMFFITWEVFRIFFAFAEVIICLLHINILVKYSAILKSVTLIFRVSCALDVYVRMHCRYYDARGILVTHPLKTAKHYLKTSFFMDLLGVIPFSNAKVPDLISRAHVKQVGAVINFLARPLQLYRFFCGLTFIQSKVQWSSASLILKIKTSILLIVFLGIMANIIMITTCTYTENDVSCSDVNFIAKSKFKDEKSPTHIFLECLYFIVTIFTQTVSGVFGMSTNGEMVMFISIQALLFLVRSWLLSLYTSSGIGGNANLSTYQARMKQFLNFAKGTVLDESLVKETISHYEHVWKETLGTDISSISSKFNLYLRIQFVCFLYETSLRCSKLFANAPPAIVQRLVPCLKEVHFKRGANIIRCNDVQKMVYFVYKGKVEVTVANTVLATLDVGGLFGCFTRTGVTRQTITATAKTHTIILELESKKLYEIMDEWNEKATGNILKAIRLLNVEYMAARSTRRSISASMTMMSKSALQATVLARYDKIIIKINEYIDQENWWYWLFEYLLNVHFAAISSIVIMANICVNIKGTFPLVTVVFIHCMDFLFLIKILLSFHLSYIDPSTGLKILDAKKIRIRCLKSEFLLYILSSIPFEIPIRLFITDYTKLACFNRVFRFIYSYNYYNMCRHRLTVSKHLSYSFITYWAIFRLQLMVNAWFVVSCFPEPCKYFITRMVRPGVYVHANTTTKSTILGYKYVINMFTSSGLRDTSPLNWKELLISIIIALFCQLIIANLSSGVANMMIIEKHTMANYAHNINKMRVFLKARHLSPSIFDKIWEYYSQLWTLQKGEWLPRLISEAPPYLKQDIFTFLFGYHLENHYLFAKTHKDFLRQMVTHLERRIYLPGNVIVEKGDMDSTMYFVHQGEIGAYDYVGKNEVLCFMVTTEMSFGEAQGLYNVPYSMMYKAETLVIVLALKKTSWHYLLKWFPASEEELKAKAAEYGLATGNCYFQQD